MPSSPFSASSPVPSWPASLASTRGSRKRTKPWLICGSHIFCTSGIAASLVTTCAQPATRLVSLQGVIQVSGHASFQAKFHVRIPGAGATQSFRQPGAQRRADRPKPQNVGNLLAGHCGSKLSQSLLERPGVGRETQTPNAFLHARGAVENPETEPPRQIHGEVAAESASMF